jgi:histidinol-phosphate aminotransferase
MNDDIKLDLNEYDFPHPPELYENIINNLKNISHYTTADKLNTLISKIASYNNICKDNIILTPGSDIALEYIIRTYPNKKIYTFIPTYSYFELLVKNLDTVYIQINLDDKIIDVYNYLSCFDMYNALVYIVNPNNPTGKLIDKESLEKCLKQFNNTIFILDEAYIEFSMNNSCMDLIQQYNNIIITRTFSKAYGLCGMRLGYIATSNIKSICYNVRSVSILSVIAGIYILDNLLYYNDIINQIKQNREDFKIFLGNNNIEYLESEGNFITILSDIDIRSKNVKVAHKIIDNKNYFRITIGNINTMDKLKEHIIKYIDEYQRNS